MSDPEPKGPAAERPDDFDPTVFVRRARDDGAPLPREVHDELHALARACMAGERPDHTLQATALVHEAWLRLRPDAPRDADGRGAFLRAAARVMRHALVDHARRRKRRKRGGGMARADFSVVLARHAPQALDADALIDLHDALSAFERVDARAARALELHVFAGLTVAETAEALGLAPSTVDLDLRAARAWLAERLAR